MQSYWFSKQSKINIIYNISIITITITMSIILANFGKYAISDCPSICLFACLWTTLRKKRVNGFSWNLQDRSGMIHGTIWKIWGVSRLTPWVLGYLYCVLRKSVSVTNITGKRMNGFSWNFQQRSDMRQGMIYNIFGMLRLTSWIHGRFFLLRGSVFVSNVMENEWTDFHEFFMKCQGRPKK